ncbi:MAG TPA: NADH:flavin oxidoreductase [Tepidisphaeraceae bacterium]|nr:NADH:flavin oxidoreductase [Tepidisphaeraceae bacterium]
MIVVFGYSSAFTGEGVATMDSAYRELFEPIKLGTVQLRNRVVVPPMLQMRPITSREGVAWYRRMAMGGPGWVTVEVTSILRFGTELTAQTLRPLAKAIHDEGAGAGIQLFPVQFGAPQDPNVLTTSQIDSILDGYARAAAICKEAGFDAVEPHGAHGYLLTQFFMPDVNHRTDDYGGSLENRCRLGLRVVQAIRKVVGPDYLIFYRHTPVGKAYGIEDSLEMGRRLIDEGVNVLDISPARQAVEADLAKPFKRLGVPVIAVNGMEDPIAAARALREGRCDLVAVGRGMIADAQWIKKVKEGKTSEIVQCHKCEVGCFGHIRTREPVYCETWQCDEVASYVR